MTKKGETIGHMPLLFSKTCSFILLSEDSMNVRVTGKQENRRGNGLEFPCIVNINVLEHMYFKIPPSYFKKT